MKLAELKPGQHASILKVGGEGALRQHFLDMGVIPGATLKVEKLAPMGDPMELRIHGYELTLRLDDARLIEIEQIEKAEAELMQPVHQRLKEALYKIGMQKGYDYILNTDNNSHPFVNTNKGEDITAEVVSEVSK